MSGGHFEYNQRFIKDIYESIEEVIDSNGQQIDKTYYNYTYPPEIIEKFKAGIKKLKEAYIYAQRIDWLLSGDDGDESFLKRLKEELNEN